MASAKTDVRIPSQYQPDQPMTEAESEYEDLERELEALGVPRKLVVSLNDAANHRVNDAYDFGVAWGLGHFPELEFQGVSISLMESIRASIQRLDALVTEAEKEDAMTSAKTSTRTVPEEQQPKRTVEELHVRLDDIERRLKGAMTRLDQMAARTGKS
jgi:hypothetical protein